MAAVRKAIPAGDDLALLITRVEAMTKAALDLVAPYGSDDHWPTRATAMASLSVALTNTVQARIDQTCGAYRVRIGGITATGATGLEGALRNWQTSARRRLPE